jgi:hypothetical protein
MRSRSRRKEGTKGNLRGEKMLQVYGKTEVEYPIMPSKEFDEIKDLTFILGSDMCSSLIYDK